MTKVKTIRGICFGAGRPKICVPLMGKTVEEVLQNAVLIAACPAEVVEWRVDHLAEGRNAAAVTKVLPVLRQKLGDQALLFTFRTAGEGGEQPITFAEYEALLLSAAESDVVDLVDVEGFLPGVAESDLIARLQAAGVGVIASNHNFHETPPQEQLVERLEQLGKLGADFAKLAVMPQQPSDVDALLAATKTYTAQPEAKLAITMSMGAMGAISRVNGEETGSVLTFGAVEKASAPGQLEVSDLLQQLNERRKA